MSLALRRHWLVAALAALAAGCGGAPARGGAFTADAKNATYSVDGADVKLASGAAKVGDAEYLLTQATFDFDLNKDGATDRVVVIGKMQGDSTSMHLVGLVSGEAGYEAVPGSSLGENLVVKGIAVEDDGKIRVSVVLPPPPPDAPAKLERAQTLLFAYQNGRLVDVTPKRVAAPAPAPAGGE